MKKLLIVTAMTAVMSFALTGAECASSDFRNYSASLRPGHEVPPVADAGQNGNATVSVETNLETVAVTVTTNINTPGKLTAAHLHLGAANANGGVLFNLGTPTGTGFQRDFTSADMSAVGTVDTWAEFLAELEAGNVYVNVHTTDNPSGEIRGQLER